MKRSGASRTVEIDVKSQDGEVWTDAKKRAKASNRGMEVDRITLAQSYFDNLREKQDYDKFASTPCAPFFPRL